MDLRFVVASALLATAALSTTAAAGESSGSAALALAALVSDSSPLDTARKTELARLLNGDSQAPWSGGPIGVTATKIVCRSSDVDVTSRSCTLSFGAATRTIGGRLANELTSTLEQAGVRGQGAAGTTYVGVIRLACSVAPATVRRRGGGGATCSFTEM